MTIITKEELKEFHRIGYILDQYIKKQYNQKKYKIEVLA